MAHRATAAQPNTRVILLADEFAALLDRVSACVVARSLRRLIAPGSLLSALVATSHSDVTYALAPNVTIRCDFGRIGIEPAPTISHDVPHKAADGIGGLCIGGLRSMRNAEKTADTIGGFVKTRPSGGPMRKIIVASLATLAVCSAPVRADEPRERATVAPRGGNDRLLLEPPSPFERPRSLFEFDPRPSRRPIMPLYPTIERELYRGADRIESDLEFDLRRRQREQDERRGDVPRQRETERFDDAYDRTLRIQRQERRAHRELEIEQRVERESERLAAERRRFYESAGIDVSGAAADTSRLRALEETYQRDLAQLRRDRALELERLAERADLSADAKRDARLAIDQRHRADAAERRLRYAHDRAAVLGHPPQPPAPPVIDLPPLDPPGATTQPAP